MGTLAKTWNNIPAKDTLGGELIATHQFLVNWERGHPACNATRGQLETAVGCAGTHVHPDDQLSAFYAVLGEDPPGRGLSATAHHYAGARDAYRKGWSDCDQNLPCCPHQGEIAFRRILGQNPPVPGPLDGKTREEVDGAVRQAVYAANAPIYLSTHEDARIVFWAQARASSAPTPAG